MSEANMMGSLGQERLDKEHIGGKEAEGSGANTELGFKVLEDSLHPHVKEEVGHTDLKIKRVISARNGNLRMLSE